MGDWTTAQPRWVSKCSDYFITWTLGTYFILSLLFLKTKVKQRKPQKGFIFHKVPEITKGGELSSRVTEVQLCFCSV